MAQRKLVNFEFEKVKTEGMIFRTKKKDPDDRFPGIIIKNTEKYK